MLLPPKIALWYPDAEFKYPPAITEKIPLDVFCKPLDIDALAEEVLQYPMAIESSQLATLRVPKDTEPLFEFVFESPKDVLL